MGGTGKNFLNGPGMSHRRERFIEIKKSTKDCTVKINDTSQLKIEGCGSIRSKDGLMAIMRAKDSQERPIYFKIEEKCILNQSNDKQKFKDTF